MPADVVSAEIAKWTIKAVASYVSSRAPLSDARLQRCEEAVSTAARDALTWASRIQVFGMHEATDPMQSTVPLRVRPNQRRFQAIGAVDEVSEDELLNSAGNVLILGDPGAGKTTTIKRMIQRTIVGDTPENAGLQIPIVVRLRELRPDESLLVRIAKALGLDANRAGPTRGSRNQVREDDDTLWIGELHAIDALAGFFVEHPCLLALDGLDEFEGDRVLVRRQLTQLSLAAPQLKIIVSCRAGDYNGGLEGFGVFQICGLTQQEAYSLVEKFGVDPQSFFAALAAVPYKDLADRPLFLTQLLLLFRRDMSLPEQPSEIYLAIVLLVLREWDADGNVIRRSRYSGFLHTRKHKFLAALSYQLTVKIKTKSFTISDLRAAYNTIYTKFGLPQDEADLVATEIESHTGLIIHSGPARYEFSHLSIQEYLAAEYMSREARGANLQAYLREYPAPVAIAIALSSNPSDALASMLLDASTATRESLISFFSRLLVERPQFEASSVLGVALIFCFLTHALDELVDPLLSLESVKDSVRDSFRELDLQVMGDQVKLTAPIGRRTLDDKTYPKSIEGRIDLLRRLVTHTGGYPGGYVG